MSIATRPRWLQTILNDSTCSAPPKLYAWTVDNLQNNGPPTKPRPPTTKRVHVLGLGNLGRLYASCLAQLAPPPPITLIVHRRRLLEHWAADPGLQITRHGRAGRRQTNVDVEWWTDEKPPVGPVREVAPLANLVVATKTTDALPQVDRLRRYLDGSSTVLFVQNGMNKLWPPDGPTYTAHRWPGHYHHPNFLHGVTMHGVFSEGAPFQSVHAAPADVVVGPVLVHPASPSTEYLTRLVTTAPHLAGRAASRPELWLLQLEKLAVNVVINPLTAVLGVKNGGLFVDPEGPVAHVMDELLRQTSHVLQALVRHPSSQALVQDSAWSQDELLQRLSLENLREMLRGVAPRVQHNKSSMLQDVEAGKPTEIRDLNGWLVETARRVDPSLDVGSHRILIDLVERGARLDEAALARRLRWYVGSLHTPLYVSGVIDS